jgi:hypothetical protein
MPLEAAAEYVGRLSRADQAQFWIDQSAPAPVRRRKREARRWIDLLTASIFNPPNSWRRAGDGWLALAEGFAIHRQAHARLHLVDRELWDVVKRTEWEDTGRHTSMTLDEWRADVHRQTPRRKRAWDEVRRFGTHPLSRDQIWTILGIASRKPAPLRPRNIHERAGSKPD